MRAGPSSGPQWATAPPLDGSPSDIPSASYSLPEAVVTVDMREKIITVQKRLKQLQKDFQGLRQMEQLNQEAMRDSFTDTFAKMKSTMHGNKTVDGEPSSRTKCIVKEKMDTATSHFNEKGKQLALPVEPVCTLSDNTQNKAEGEKSCDSKAEKALSTFSKV